MAKPSIFSRDYEKIMKRRKRRIFLTIFLVLVLVLGVFFKIAFKDTDFSHLRDKMQAWVDSDKIDDKPQKDENKVVEEEKKQEEQEVEVKDEKKYIDLVVNENKSIKVEVSEENGDKHFIDIAEGIDITGMEYNISPSKKLLLVSDENQNVYIFDTNGDKKDITRASYVSQNGDVYLKDNILQSYQGYAWQEQVKFIDDNKVAYISQLPYFGTAATNKYIWIYDIVNNMENCLWGYTGNTITLGNVIENKGLELNIDGVQYYVDYEGNIVQ